MMKAASWYLGDVPGKPRVFMPYLGGVGNIAASAMRSPPTTTRLPPGSACDYASHDVVHLRRVTLLAVLDVVEHVLAHEPLGPLSVMPLDGARDRFVVRNDLRPFVRGIQHLGHADGPDGVDGVSGESENRVA
jgi:hypothetical protein